MEEEAPFVIAHGVVNIIGIFIAYSLGLCLIVLGFGREIFGDEVGITGMVGLLAAGASLAFVLLAIAPLLGAVGGLYASRHCYYSGHSTVAGALGGGLGWIAAHFVFVGVVSIVLEGRIDPALLFPIPSYSLWLAAGAATSGGITALATAQRIASSQDVIYAAEPAERPPSAAASSARRYAEEENWTMHDIDDAPLEVVPPEERGR